MAKNCKNCGAPLTESVCPYCGTSHEIFAIDKASVFSIETEYTEIGNTLSRDEKGRIVRKPPKIIKKVTAIYED